MRTTKDTKVRNTKEKNVANGRRFLYTHCIMKVCHITNLYKPYAVGGAERFVEESVNEGDAVISWMPWEGLGSWKPHRTVEDGVIVYRYWAPNVFSYTNLSRHGALAKLLWHKIDIWNWWSGRIVRSILLQEKPDVVNTHNLMGIGFSIPKVIQKLGIKHVHTLHDIQLVEPSGVLTWNHEKDSLVQRAYSWVMRRRMGKPDEMVALSDFLKRFYRERGFFETGNWSDAKYGLRTEASEKLETWDLKRQDTRYKIQTNNGSKRFLFVGSLVKHKGIEVLMHAWEKLPKDFSVELHIVGDGVLRQEVEEWVREDRRVTVHGRLERDDVEKMYEMCDVLVFPSVCIENRPTVIVEALEHGLSIIASDTGGVGELLDGKINARLVKPGDAEELVKKMIALIN